ncbi:uncharacterized protein K02A2.6-like [Malaya genurostris]|uniref:uncharacterized protein K02A2.6-like n=1 Tax=Malaya genurostris TaxID=325434 RepID=UPI0026F3C4FD|nr:uncharacterized protein K02A2.6-like [Malaya genurostris]
MSIPNGQQHAFLQQQGQQQQVPQATDELLRQCLHLMTQVLQQQQNSQQSQENFIRQVVSEVHAGAAPSPEQILDSLAGNITEFRYDADSSITFAAWFTRYDELFEKDAARLDDQAKVRLLLRKLGTSEHERHGLKSERDSETRTRLLSWIEENNNLTLEQLSNECQRLINLKHDNAMIESAASFDQVNQLKQKYDSNRNRRQLSPRSDANNTKRKPDTPCWYCGAFHYVRDCPYKNRQCPDCSRYGHRQGYCASSKKKKRGGKRSVASRVVVVNMCNVQRRRKFVSVVLNGTHIHLQLDTASDITVISKPIWRKVGSPILSPSTVKAKTASGNILPLEGEFRCDVTIGGNTRSEIIRVTEKQLQLLGSDLVDSFDLWSVPMDTFCCQVSSSSTSSAALSSAFPEVFSEKLGLCNKVQVKLDVEDQCKPIFCPKRPVVYSMYNAVDQELDRLQQLNIITPVDYSEWAAPIVVVRKANGAIRVCGDYSTGLNSALQPHQYPLPLPEDIFAKLANCKVFSQIDLSDAFLQVEVDEQFRHLLTINTHRGLFHYNRLPPGVKVAPGIFQQLIDTMLAGLEKVSGYLDDVIVGGEDEAAHNRNLKAVLQRIQDFGFTIRAEKCTFGKKQIPYLGYIVDHRGLRPDPAKIEAIVQLPPPTDVHGVRSFLGAINYYGKLVPNMRMLRFPLDNLLKSQSKFQWTTECQQAYERFKQILTSDLLLTHYDPKKEIIVSADASSVGVGATISHRWLHQNSTACFQSTYEGRAELQSTGS